jgi:hypothetical protein
VWLFKLVIISRLKISSSPGASAKALLASTEARWKTTGVVNSCAPLALAGQTLRYRRYLVQPLRSPSRVEEK